MSRKIPFHLQLSLDPPPSSLDPETNPEPASPTKQSSSRSSNESSRPSKFSRFSRSSSTETPSSSNQQHRQKKRASAPAPAPTLISSLLTSQAVVKVTLQRQISVDVRSQRVLKTVVCGEGYMHRVRLSSNSSTNGESSGSTSSSPMSRSWGPAPATIAEEDGAHTDLSGPRRVDICNYPPATADVDELEAAGHGEFDEEQDWAGWEGEVIPSKQINVGGFRTAGLTIRVRSFTVRAPICRQPSPSISPPGLHYVNPHPSKSPNIPLARPPTSCSCAHSNGCVGRR
jgi:hypothetical protein